MVDPLVVQVLREHKQAILAQEQSVMEDMARRWVQMERRLDAQFTALAAEADQLRQAGQVINQAKLMEMERYQQLLFQAHAQMNGYIGFADQTIRDYQESLASQGIENAAEAIRAVYSQAGVIGAQFNTLPVGALEAIIGMAGDGTPLDQYLRRIYGDATDGLTQALIDGLARGLNPVKTAREMTDGFGMGLNHALNTARTESLRAYRTASQRQYVESGVVTGWKRLAAHDERTCAGCLFTEGDFYQNEDEFEEHNQGRCTPVPCVMGVDAPSWQSGQDWFLEQSDETQASILGQGRFDAWKGGADLNKMATRVYDPVWGGAFVPTPVDQLAGSD